MQAAQPAINSRRLKQFARFLMKPDACLILTSASCDYSLLSLFWHKKQFREEAGTKIKSRTSASRKAMRERRKKPEGERGHFR